MERTFVMVKPDGVQRGLVSQVIGRFEAKGLKLVAMKLMRIPRETAERHYAEHRDKPFFAGLVDFITSGPVVAMAWEGPKAIELCRALMGATDPAKAAPGTIRGDFGVDIGQNIVHGSDSAASAERELGLFFDEGDFVSYDRATDRWVWSD